MAIAITEAREDLGNIVNRVSLRGERVILSRNGKNAAAIVSMEDLELLRQIEDRVDLKAARAALAEGAGISLDKAAKELGL